MAVLIQLARQALLGLGVGQALELATPGIDIPFIPGGGGGNGLARRRRRRKALTADDMRVALTIASAISKKAAENFILSRTRAS